MLDARKPLEALREEWKNCTRCSLGERRVAVGGSFVFGEGAPRGLLLLAEGPGQVEEERGAPFVGPSGDLLRTVLSLLEIKHYYMMNVVACRSCSHATDQAGQPIFRHRKGKPSEPLYRDEAPNKVQVAACSPRVFEQIYLIDPILIVSMGVPATEFLLNRSVTINMERGREREIGIPGAAFVPSVTEKRGVWHRKINGVMQAPVEQNKVRYLVLPTLHPAYVLRNKDDKRPTGPPRMFVSDLRKAHQIYKQYTVDAQFAERGYFNNDNQMSDDDILDSLDRMNGDHDE